MPIPRGVDIFYRFCVCQFISDDLPSRNSGFGSGSKAAREEKMVVRRWETNIRPRKIGCHGKTALLLFCDLLIVFSLGFNFP